MSTTREDLLAAALRILESDGPEALRARTVTAEIGASTMAVYTHFGGMPRLLEEMVRDGLSRFAAHVRQVPDSDDPMADLIAGGLAYGEFAFQNSQLYRLMFGLTGAAVRRGAAPAIDAGVVWRTPEGIDTFSVLLRAVERVIDAGEISPQDPGRAAVQILSVTHGYVLLVIGGFVTEEPQDLIPPLTVNLMVGLGGNRKKVERSLERARASRARHGHRG